MTNGSGDFSDMSFIANIDIDGDEPLIQTVRGFGYKIREV